MSDDIIVVNTALANKDNKLLFLKHNLGKYGIKC